MSAELLNDGQKNMVEQMTARELLEWKACANPDDELVQAAIQYGLARKGAQLAAALRGLS